MKKLKFICFLALFAFAVDSCKKEDPIVESPGTPETPVNAAREAAVKKYKDEYVASSTKDYVWNGNLDNCNPGTLSDEIQRKVIQRANYYRSLVGLYPIELDKLTCDKAQQMALMIKKNSKVSHFPPQSWECYTAGGSEAAQNSNLINGTANSEAIDGYIQDDGSQNYEVGHRRWIIYSEAGNFGHGATNSSDVLWVSNTRTQPKTIPEFISWPSKGYCPSNLAYRRWSFGVPDADFSSATVTMTDFNKKSIALTLEPLSDPNAIMGDKTIVWVPEGINKTSTQDVAYKVKVSNVKVKGQVKNYEYDVILFKP